MTAHQVAAWAALGARFVTVRRSFSTADDPDVDIDTTGSLTDWMKRFHARVLVVRPDRFVAAMTSPHEINATTAKLAALLHAPLEA